MSSVSDLVNPLNASAFTQHVGVAIDAWGDGSSRTRLPYRAQIGNSHGTVHGGAIFTLADVGMGLAAISVCPPGMVSLTRSAHIDYLKSAREAELICIAKVQRHDDEGATVSADIFVAERLVSRVTGDFAFRPRRQ